MSSVQEVAAYTERVERIAAFALQGLLAHWSYSKSAAASEAVNYAIEVIARVDEHTAAHGKVR